MKNAKFVMFFMILFAVSALSAEVYGNMIGGEPAESWEDGGQDFFVMFNSNLDDKFIFEGEELKNPDETDQAKKIAVNPQGDTCLEESKFTLDKFHIPEDAIIEKAYLIWMGAVDPEKLDEPTDNEVFFSFEQAADPSVKVVRNNDEGNTPITAPEAKKIPNLDYEGYKASFGFEGLTYKDEVEIGCSETAHGTPEKDFRLGYFTYRVDITDFFNEIYAKNKEKGHQEGSGEYYGTYTFSGLDCTEHDAYKCKTTMVSAWSVFFIYRSKHIKPKKIYFYNGLSFVYGIESTAKVSGFELPNFPTMRLTTMIAEGDPSLVKPELANIEEISLMGENAERPYMLYNDCNPMTSYNDTTVSYYEVYNSISSIVNWDPAAEESNKLKCVSGADEGVNYGIDVDTFLLDSENDPNLQEHLLKGNKSMDVRLSVNQDAIFTNFMVLSVDIKGSNFDIPDEDEKYFCACPSTDASATDYYCPGSDKNREFFYLVKVQNWGEDEAESVRIADELDSQLVYVPGTTAMATNCRKATKDDETKKGDICDDWKPIPDKEGEGNARFPLSGKGYKLSDKMRQCYMEGEKKVCLDKILVRYKVKPKPLAEIGKNAVFSNIAELSDSKSDSPYKTNRSYPLKLKPGSCVPVASCATPTEEMCGGVKNDKECGEEGLPQCGTGYVCENFKCKDDPETMCSAAELTLAPGKNTPPVDTNTIIAKDNNGLPLVLGQFTLQASNCDEGKVFNFDAFSVRYDTKSDDKFSFSEVELIYDKDGNGIYDETAGDKIISASVDENPNNEFYISVKSNAKKYIGKELSYFLVRAKVDYKKEEVAKNTSFRFFLESGAVRANATDDGNTAKVTFEKNKDEIEFATFYLEPTGNYFIITIGAHDPSVPPISEMNGGIPVMQLRTKAVEVANTVKTMIIKVPSDTYVKFGDKNGIKGISLWIDSNNDGKGDTKIAEKTTFESGESSKITFKSSDFSKPLKYEAGEEKYLVVNVDFNMTKSEPPMAGRIQIAKGLVLSESETQPYEIPIKSKVFTYSCQEGDVSCETEKKSGGCAVLEVESDNTELLFVALISVAAMLGLALLRKKLS